MFREVRRVLRDDGTLWLNLGDSYVGPPRGNLTPREDQGNGAGKFRIPSTERIDARLAYRTNSASARVDGLKQKDLVGIPWRVAFALQADGWVLRSDITWAKPNPMPESVTDRPTKSHEMLFLFAKATWSGPEPGRYGHISDEDARWLALLFDTEGNIVIKRAQRGDRTQYGAQMAFANCSRRLLEHAQSMIGAGSLHTRPGTNADVHYWQMTGQEARDLLHRIYPYLIVKQRQARVAIYMQDVVAEPKCRPGGYRTTEHAAFLERCWQTVKALNQFGDPDLSWVPEPKFGGWSGCERYFYDADAIREPHEASSGWSKQRARGEDTWAYGRTAGGNTTNGVGSTFDNPAGRNRRSVWTISTEAFPEAHFATYPQALVAPCVLAGTSEKGGCSECGAPWVRITIAGGLEQHPSRGTDDPAKQFKADGRDYVVEPASSLGLTRARIDGGWTPSCSCIEQAALHDDPTPEQLVGRVQPQLVLDPFIGSGTTALVARKHGRRCIGIDLSAEYLAIAAKRTQQLSLLGGAA